MRYWFRGKRGGLAAFLAIAALVTGGLAWVTADALRLERQQLEARAEVDSSSKLRIALWRLDSRMVTVFTNEANRPYTQYRFRSVLKQAPGKGQPAATVVELTALPESEPTSWLTQNFVVGSGKDWQSARLLHDTLARHLGIADEVRKPDRPAAMQQQLVAFLSSDQVLQRLLTQVRQEDSQLAQARQQDAEAAANNLVQRNQDEGGAANGPAAAPRSQTQAPPGNTRKIANANPLIQQRKNRDTELRYAVRAQGARNGYEQLNNTLNANTDAKPGGKDASPEPAVLGPVIPLWLGSEEDRLVVARLIQIGPRLACHVTLLDWSVLQAVLAEHVADLFPEARFLPIHDAEEANPERAMTALPVELDPGPVEVSAPRRWSAMRVGLVVAWIAAVVALAAVGLGGWSLLDFSERRVRFVSAVTHELRTPLTTLRLYLDMLTGGLVREESQKAEYLHTLHAEADRLHRLIGNVLDFSRLENQRPRLEKSTERVGDILELLHRTWEDRCRSAGKELAIESGVPGDLSLHTDVRIVQQILGNLIDNACKYSREAADQHIWVRAYTSGPQRVVFEVEDHGPGVPPREARTIFRPFRRGRDADVTAGGVGLGLALALRRAQMLGGRLSLRGGPENVGACFRLELPLELDREAG